MIRNLRKMIRTFEQERGSREVALVLSVAG